MRFWDNIRNYFYRKNLEERVLGLKAKRTIANMQEAASIGIMYDSTYAENDALIAKFAADLKKQNKEVSILGFVNDKKTSSKPDILLFNKKNLNWARIPRGEEVEKFADKNFDLLLACFAEENLPLEYIARISKAGWRVGVYAANKTECYDMMVNTGGKKELSYLLEQMTNFLKQIKV